MSDTAAEIQFDDSMEAARMFRGAIIAREKECPAYWMALETLARDFQSISAFLAFLAKCGSRPMWLDSGFYHICAYVLPRLTDSQSVMLTGKTRSEWMALID